VTEADPRLRPGLSATVDFLVDELNDALYVPISAVFVDELDRMVAYRKTGRDVEARPLVLGGSTDRIAVVSEGLEEGDQVLLVAPEPG
jgi:hypothetical protein